MTTPTPTGRLTADRATLHAMRHRLGHQSAQLMFDLADLAQPTAEGLVIEASLRDIAAFAASSKDTVRRSLDRLTRHRLIERLDMNDDRFATPRYLLHLDVAGISVAA